MDEQGRDTMRVLLVILACCWQLAAHAQGECAFDAIMQQACRDRAYAAHLQAAEAAATRGGVQVRGTGGPLRIPVVVHILHRGEAIGTTNNPADSVIMNALECANQRFAGSIGSGADTEISFCLAQVDPDGAPTNGIDRIDGTLYPGYATTGMSSSYLPQCTGPTQFTVSNDHGWPVEQYYNVYLVFSICGANNAGFAYLPSFQLPSWDGAYLITSTFTCTGYIATHELGHGMGLYHTFEGDGGSQFCPPNADCGQQGDRVCDTAPHRSSDCASLVALCDTATTLWTDTRRNFMNYCFYERFTPGQRDRMHAQITTLRGGLLNTAVCETDSNLTTSAGTDLATNGSGFTLTPTGTPGVFLAMNTSATDCQLQVLDVLGRGYSTCTLMPGTSMPIQLPTGRGGAVFVVQGIFAHGERMVRRVMEE